MKRTRIRKLLALLLAGAAMALPADAGGKLIGTGGVTSVEGASGGGIVPWATLAGMGTEDEIAGGTAFATGIWSNDFRLEAFGAAVTLYDRVELSYAHQRLKVEPLDTRLRQHIAGMKVRFYGDLIYTRWPQVAAGLQYKWNPDMDVPNAVGAKDDWGIDVYLSATKLWIDGPFHRYLLLNGTLRATRSNELGLLGFGGPRHGDYRALFEGSLAWFPRRDLAIGYEYRQKSNNLAFADEDDWQDVFLAWFPNEHVALVAAYARLGGIAGFPRQDGFFLSLQAGL
jgi:hypothetical protein